MSEQARIRSENFVQSKLNFERHKSEETISRLQKQSKALRYNIIELESTYLPKIENLTEKINKQSEQIAE
jgi:gas vesicle protein